MGHSRRNPLVLVAIVWLCFMTRGFFYCSFLPLWEGYDEWAHFGFIQELVSSSRLLVNRTEPVSMEVQASMKLAPAPWGTGTPYITEDQYWRLSAAERAQRAAKLHDIPFSWSNQSDTSGGGAIYEALQPPLYYWISSLAYRLVATRSLLERVFILRYVSVFICSFTIPIAFLIAQRASASMRTALFVTILVSVLPELMIDIGRIGNECLGIPIFSCLTLLALASVKQDLSVRLAVWTGIVLGLGLLTKAYFLTSLPALAVLYLICMLRSVHRREWVLRVPIVFVIASAIAGWWYVRNRVTTGSWTGLLESTKLANYSLSQFRDGAMHVDWRGAVDSILFSHIWFGAWSALHVRSWIYHIFFVIIAAGAVGVAAALWKNSRQRIVLLPFLLIYGFFWLGQLYNVLLLFMTKGASTSMGWYMYCVVAPEIMLLVIGVQSLTPTRLRYWALFVLVTLVGALDLYTVHFISIPYYAGLAARV